MWHYAARHYVNVITTPYALAHEPLRTLSQVAHCSNQDKYWNTIAINVSSCVLLIRPTRPQLFHTDGTEEYKGSHLYNWTNHCMEGGTFKERRITNTTRKTRETMRDKLSEGATGCWLSRLTRNQHLSRRPAWSHVTEDMPAALVYSLKGLLRPDDTLEQIPDYVWLWSATQTPSLCAFLLKR